MYVNERQRMEQTRVLLIKKKNQLGMDIHDILNICDTPNILNIHRVLNWPPTGNTHSGSMCAMPRKISKFK